MRSTITPAVRHSFSAAGWPPLNELEHRLGTGDWETLLVGTTLTETMYVGVEGTHTFRVLACDGANNESLY